jgi:hypothetical protein
VAALGAGSSPPALSPLGAAASAAVARAAVSAGAGAKEPAPAAAATQVTIRVQARRAACRVPRALLTLFCCATQFVQGRQPFAISLPLPLPTVRALKERVHAGHPGALKQPAAHQACRIC